MIKFLYAALAAVASLGGAGTALAQIPNAAYSTYVVSGDGQEVTDNSTGLVWRRCAEGSRWDGNNCSGVAGTYNYSEALGRINTAIGLSGEQAQTRAVNPGAWRLPTVYELSSITDRNRSNPTIDSAAFPNTPASWHWTSTFDTNNPSYIWIISFYNGYASNIGPYNKGYVRLVRGASQSAPKTQ